MEVLAVSGLALPRKKVLADLLSPRWEVFRVFRFYFNGDIVVPIGSESDNLWCEE
jgi:hypothetical protein